MRRRKPWRNRREGFSPPIPGLRTARPSIGCALPKQPVVNADETGWKVRGSQWYVWIFCNRSVVFCHADRSRYSKVVEDILGKDYAGTAVCDFYAAYNFLLMRQDSD